MLRDCRSSGKWKTAAVFLCSFHLFLALLFNARIAFSHLSSGATVFPERWRDFFRAAGDVTTIISGGQLDRHNILRRGLVTYQHLTGIETGYGFFAPNVAISHKLVFVVKYSDGHVEYELPSVAGSATGTRMPLLLDSIAHTPYEPLRQTMLKMMAFKIWQRHPDAEVIRAVFGYVDLPGLSDYACGMKESYEDLFAYDFRFGQQPSPVRD